MIQRPEAYYCIGVVNEIVPTVDLITRARSILSEDRRQLADPVRFGASNGNNGLETADRGNSDRSGLFFSASARTDEEGMDSPQFLESARRNPRSLKEVPDCNDPGDTKGKR